MQKFSYVCICVSIFGNTGCAVWENGDGTIESKQGLAWNLVWKSVVYYLVQWCKTPVQVVDTRFLSSFVEPEPGFFATFKITSSPLNPQIYLIALLTLSSMWLQCFETLLFCWPHWHAALHVFAGGSHLTISVQTNAKLFANFALFMIASRPSNPVLNFLQDQSSIYLSSENVILLQCFLKSQ